MADYFIDGNAAALREAFIVQAGWVTALARDKLAYRIVDAGRIHARFDQGTRKVQRTIIDDTSSPDAFNIMGIVDDLLRWRSLSLEYIKPHLTDPLVEIFVALLIFFAAATPANFISLHKTENLL